MTEGPELLAKERTITEANESVMPTSPSPASEVIPIDTVLTAQIDAGAAAFKRVMEGLPEDGEHRQLLEKLQQLTALHYAFGDDEVWPAAAFVDNGLG